MSLPVAVVVKPVPAVGVALKGPVAVKVNGQLKGETGLPGPRGETGEPGSGLTKAEAEAIVNAKAVLVTGTQTVAGTKTFSSSPLVPAPASASSAISQEYLQQFLEGITAHANVALATIAPLPANAYVTGVLTGTALGALSIDGTAAVVGQRVLVKSEVATANNGIYTVTHAGGVAEAYVLTRVSDMAHGATVKTGSLTWVMGGATEIGKAFWVVGVGPFTVGTNALEWQEYIGGVTQAEIEAALPPSVVISSSRNGGLEVYQNFSFSPNGILNATKADSSQTWLVTGYGALPYAFSEVENGELVRAPTSVLAAVYNQLPLVKPGKRIGATLSFTPYTEVGGAAAIILWETPIEAGANPNIPNAPIHFVISPTSYSVDAYTGDVKTIIVSKFWETPLIADGKTQYSVDIQLDRDENALYILVTNSTGEVILAERVEHELIGLIPGLYPCWEHFGSNANYTSPKFRAVWADSQQPAPIVAMKAAVRGAVVAAAGKSTSVMWATTDGNNIVIPKETTDMAPVGINAANFAISPVATSGVTITIASPGVFTLAKHGFNAGDAVKFSTTGALPTGLTANTDYFVLLVGLTENEFQVATSSGGTAINTSGSQSGVHTVTKVAAGLPPLGHPTITIASPGVVTMAEHNMTAGDAVVFSTTGALPTGLAANTTYYVLSDANLTANTFDLGATPGGTAINTSGSQSGVHTVWNTSLYIPVVPPASGKVKVTIQATLSGSNGTASAVALYLILREGSTVEQFAEVASIPANIATTPAVPGSLWTREPLTFLLTGLTPANGFVTGNTFKMRLQCKASAASVGVIRSSYSANGMIYAESTPLP